jgi:hypothetical protein
MFYGIVMCIEGLGVREKRMLQIGVRIVTQDGQIFGMEALEFRYLKIFEATDMHMAICFIQTGTLFPSRVIVLKMRRVVGVVVISLGYCRLTKWL